MYLPLQALLIQMWFLVLHIPLSCWGDWGQLWSINTKPFLSHPILLLQRRWTQFFLYIHVGMGWRPQPIDRRDQRMKLARCRSSPRIFLRLTNPTALKKLTSNPLFHTSKSEFSSLATGSRIPWLITMPSSRSKTFIAKLTASRPRARLARSPLNTSTWPGYCSLSCCSGPWLRARTTRLLDCGAASRYWATDQPTPDGVIALSN